MNVEIVCSSAPQLASWVDTLVDQGWKLSEHTADTIHAGKQIGQSRFPVKNATRWSITLTEPSDADPDVIVTVDVPAFADSPFSRMRIYEEFRELVERTGEVQTEVDLDIDILAEVRD